MRVSPFIKDNPLYRIATGQNFSSNEIQFKPIIDVLDLVYGVMSFGNYFINVTDFRNYTFPYHSPSVFSVSGYKHEEIGGLDWLSKVLHPDDLPIFMEYSVKILSFIAQFSGEKKQRMMINHCYRIKHGVLKEYIWIYQQHHMSYIDENGAIVYSISLLTDVSHLLVGQNTPTWSVIERHSDGRTEYCIGSMQNWLGDKKQLQLTAREKQIISLSARGLPSRQIANQLNLSYETVLSHRKKILRKTQSGNMAEAVSFAINLGYL